MKPTDPVLNNTDETGPLNAPPVPQAYEIRVEGCLDPAFWADWFGDLAAITCPEDGTTTLRGPVADQAELYGLLTRLRNKGLRLISVHPLD